MDDATSTPSACWYTVAPNNETEEELTVFGEGRCRFCGRSGVIVSRFSPKVYGKCRYENNILLRLRLFKEVCGMKKRFSAQELRELRNLIPINTVIKELLSIPSKISEGHFRFLCPLCNEFQTSTNPSTNLARCYHCEKNFNPIDMVMAVKANQFIESATYLQEVLSRSRQVKKMLADIDAKA